MGAIAALGMQAGEQLVSGAIGQLFAGANDRRQIRQQKKLQELEISGSKQLTDYNYAKQLQMWHDTNYSAQVSELEKAGLNPGLLYGQGGGGGTTTGSGGGAKVTGAQAPVGGGEIMGMMQLRSQQAQIDLMKAQAKKTDVEAAKLAGIDTAKATAEKDLAIAQTGNTEADTKLKKVNTEIAQKENNFLGATMNDRVETIREEYRKVSGEASQALIKAGVDEATKNSVIRQIKYNETIQQTTNALLTAQTKSETKKLDVMDADIEVARQTAKQIADKIWSQALHDSAEQQEVNIKKILADYETDLGNQMIEALTKTLGTIISVRTGMGAAKK